MYQVALNTNPLDYFLRHFAVTSYAKMFQFDQTYGVIYVEPFEVEPFEPFETIDILASHPMGHLMFFIMVEEEGVLQIPRDGMYTVARLIFNGLSGVHYEDINTDEFDLSPLVKYEGLNVDDMIYKLFYHNKFLHFDDFENVMETAKSYAVDAFNMYRLTHLQITFDLYENEPSDSGYCAPYSNFLDCLPTTYRPRYFNPIRGGGFRCT